MMQAAPAAEIIQVAPVQAAADFVVVARDARNEVVATADLTLPLLKAGRTEEALLRQAVFVTATTTVTRPLAQPAPDTYRWSYESFLQRQLCFTSMTGQFACTVAEVVGLPDKVVGEAPAPPLPADGGVLMVPAADNAKLALVAALRGKAQALFDDDRRAKVEPVFRAAGVTVRRPAR